MAKSTADLHANNFYNIKYIYLKDIHIHIYRVTHTQVTQMGSLLLVCLLALQQIKSFSSF